MKAVLDKARNLNIITKLMTVSFILLACIFGYELLNNKTYAAETSVFAYSASTSYVRSADEVVIKLQGVEDKLYKSNTLTADKITVKVGDTTVTPSTKTLTSETAVLGMPRYSLTLSGLTGNGALKISIADSTISDDAGNLNNINEWSTPIIIDNAPPTAGTMTMKLGSSTGNNYADNTWTNQGVYVAVNNGSDTGSGHKSTTYSVNGGSAQTTAQTITAQGTHKIVVTTIDNALNTSTRTYTVKIDKTAPTISVSPTTATVAKTTNVKIIVGESGGSGLLSSNSYQYQLSTSNTIVPTGTWTTYSSESTGTTATIGNGLTGTYYLWIKEIKDNAGNVSSSSGTKTSTYHVFGTYTFDNKAPAIAFSPNGNATYAKTQSTTVKVTDSGTSGVNTNSLKYQWTQSTTAPLESTFSSTFTNNQAITKSDSTGTNWYLWILAKDNLGNTTITNSNAFYLDNTAPTKTSYEIKNLSTTGYDVYVYGVTDSNSGINRVQFPTWTGSTQDDIQSSWQTSLAAKGNLQSDGTTWVYRVNVTDHKNEYGQYNTHVYMYDNLGNSTSFAVDTTKIVVPSVKVTYDNNDGLQNKITVEKGYGAQLGALPVATRKGYTFSGWYTASSGGTQISETTTTPASDITYYAHWTIITYNISYDLTGGSVSGNPTTYNIETPVFTLNKPTKTGYIFSGWTESQDNLGPISTLSQGISFNGTQITIANTKEGNVFSGSKIQLWNNTTYLQQIDSTVTSSKSKDFVNTYDTGNYNLRFGANGSTQDSTFLVSIYLVKGMTYHYEWEVESFNQSEMVINNLKFYKNDGATIGIPNNTIGKGNIGNRKYTAQWTPITYTISYNGNGSTAGNTESSTHTYDKSKALTSNGFTRKYTVTYDYNGIGIANTTSIATYTFKNWNIVAGGTGTTYTNAQSVVNLSSTNGANIPLYAQWNSASVTLPTPTRTGYIFAGWYTNSALTDAYKLSDTVYTPTENITLYAKWIPITYYVKYNGNGATGGTMENSTHIYDVDKNLTSNGYSRGQSITYNHNYTGSTNTVKSYGYNVESWNTKADGSGTRYTLDAKVVNLSSTNGEIINLYAQWILSTDISYTPTRTGYIFEGWYKEAECTNKIEDNYSPTSNVTVYAKWTPITYYIKYNGNGSTSGTMNNSTHTYDTYKTLTTNGFTRTGYALVGWSASSSATNSSYKNGASVKNLSSTNGATINLYAIWIGITTQPASVAVNQGTATSFSVAALNAKTYQWQYRVNSSATWTNVTAIQGTNGTTTKFTTVATTSGMNGYQFKCIATNDTPSGNSVSVESNVVTLTVYYPPTVTGPSNTTKKEGDTATFSVSATGGNPGTGFTYQWYKVVGTTATSISGATSSSYSFTATSALNQTGYYCVVSNGKMSATSSKGILTSGNVTGGTTKYIKHDGGAVTLTPTKSGAAGTLNWTTNNATNAKLSATSGNSVTVTAGSTAGDYSVTATDAVTGASTTYTIKVTSITSYVGTTSVKSMTLDLSGTKSQTITTTGTNQGAITYTSTSNSIATVTSTGTVTGVANGTCTITATESNGGATATISVTVQTSPTAITLNKTSLTFNAANNTATQQLSVTEYTPSTANVNKTITWTSDNIAVATVNSSTGLVTAVGQGTCTITAKTANGKTKTCTVLVDTVLPIWSVTKKTIQ